MTLKLSDLHISDHEESLLELSLESLQDEFGIAVESLNSMFFETKEFELQAALENLDNDLEKLGLLSSWQQLFSREGVCVASVESLVESFPEYAGQYDLSTYTELPSKVNLDYVQDSLEGIVESILDSINRHMGLIIAALVGFIGYFVGRWLVRRDAKNITAKGAASPHRFLTDDEIHEVIRQTVKDTVHSKHVINVSVEDRGDLQFGEREQEQLSIEISKVFNDAINMFGRTITTMLNSLDEQRDGKSTFDEIKEKIINEDSEHILNKIEVLLKPYGKEVCDHFRFKCSQLLNRVIKEQIMKHQLDRKYNLPVDQLIISNGKYELGNLIKTVKAALNCQLNQLDLMKQETQLLKESVNPNLGSSQATHILTELEKLFTSDNLHLTPCSLGPLFEVIKHHGGELPVDDTDFQQVSKLAGFKPGNGDNFWGYHGCAVVNANNNNLTMFNSPFWSKMNKPALSQAIDLGKVKPVNVSHYESEVKLIKSQAEGLSKRLNVATSEIQQLSKIDILKPGHSEHDLRLPEHVIQDEKKAIVWPKDPHSATHTTLFEVKRQGHLIRNNYLLSNRILIIRRLSSVIADLLKTIDRSFSIQTDREHYF